VPQARAANLTLLAAFPRAGVSPAAQCGGACQGSGAMGTADASACGHMYLDDGVHIQGPKPSFLRDAKDSDPRKPCPWHTTLFVAPDNSDMAEAMRPARAAAALAERLRVPQAGCLLSGCLGPAGAG